MQGKSHQKSHFSTDNPQARRECHNIFKVIKGKNLQPRILYPARLSFRFDGEIKSFRDKHHKTSYSTNDKVISVGRKHKRRKTPTENKPQTIKKMVIGSYILIITLNVNGLNAPTKRHSLAKWMKTHACMHFHLPHHLLDTPSPQIVCNCFILLS